MLELKGKYNTAKVFTDVVDQESISQVVQILNLESLKDTKIRMMPDIHAGKGCTVGTTISLHDKVIPNLVGVDIGCGMYVCKLKEKEIDLPKLDQVIYEKVPFGFSVNEIPHPDADLIPYKNLRCYHSIDEDNARKSIGSLGGGNHFVECNRDDDGNLYIVIHSGSRHLGLEVCKYYQNLAYQKCNRSSEKDVKNLITRLKEEGRQQEIEKELKKLKNVKTTNIPKDLCHLSGEDFENYIHDMKIVQEYANINRKVMANVIINAMGLTVDASFTTIHNYIDTEAMILRKGSVSAKKGEMLLIPINMRDGSLICIGKGNPDWNYSAPHGAGRLMSRSKAKENINMDDFKKSMEGIYSTSVCESTLDESAFAYKSLEDIVGDINETVKIVKQIKPIYNFKAH